MCLRHNLVDACGVITSMLCDTQPSSQKDITTTVWIRRAPSYSCTQRRLMKILPRLIICYSILCLTGCHKPTLPTCHPSGGELERCILPSAPAGFTESMLWRSQA